MSLRETFEKELKRRLPQKATSNQSEEAVLLKSFKFIDLQNSGEVDFQAFVKTMEKVGLLSFSRDQLKELFDDYPQNRTGFLDYKSFIAQLFGTALPKFHRRPTAKPGKYTLEEIDRLIEIIKATLSRQGPGGILGLGKQFLLNDRNGDRGVDRDEFLHSLRESGINISEDDANKLFLYFDRDRVGCISFDEFILAIRGKMNEFRKKLVIQAFNVLETGKHGDLSFDDLKERFDPTKHPDVKAGRKTTNEVLHDFLQTFESVYDYHRIDDNRVTLDEFMEYYNFVSATIESDPLFELMMNNAWKMNEPKPVQKQQDSKGYTSQFNSERPLSSGQRTPPPKSGQRTPINREPDVLNFPTPGKVGSQSQNIISHVQSQNPPTECDVQAIINKIREKLNIRGAKSYIGLQRQFRIMDEDNDKAISYKEFVKGMRDFKIDLGEQETRAAFKEFDSDYSGKISIDEFIREVRGGMNDFRLDLVKEAFDHLDRDHDGVIRINDIKSLYSARNHPDVRSGKKSEDEVLGEFLETFEVHHGLRTGYKDQNVTLPEFIEYYNNVSANIDDDRYFEHVIVTAWRLYQYDARFREYAPPGFDNKPWPNAQVKNVAPFGTSSEPTEYKQQPRPSTPNQVTPAGKVFKEKELSSTPKLNLHEKSAEELLGIFRKKIAARGARGMIGLSRSFGIIDEDHSRTLSLQEFVIACKNFRMDFTTDEMKKLFTLFDRNHSGDIDYDEFLRTVRGPMSPARQKVVKLAFLKLDANNDGVITLEEVKQKYSAKMNPDVRSGKRHEEDVLVEFLDTFEQHHATHTGDPHAKEPQVTWEEFLDYYNNISCSIDDDRYFEQMVKNAWGIDTYSYQKGAKFEYQK